MNAFKALAATNTDGKPIKEHPGNPQPKAQATRDLTPPVFDATSSRTLEHWQLCMHPAYKDIWDASYTNELGRLCQGIGKHPMDPTKNWVDGTNTFRHIKYHNIPIKKWKDVTYSKVVCKECPQKEDPHHTHITINGNCIAYPGNTGTKMGSVELVKTIINSTLSRLGACFASFDIKTSIWEPPWIVQNMSKSNCLSSCRRSLMNMTYEYNLMTYIHDGWVYFEITKVVYGLKQARKLANNLLTTHLEAHGYFQCATMASLWQHKWWPILFVFIVDDFGIKYVGKQHTDHLHVALSEHYQVTTD